MLALKDKVDVVLGETEAFSKPFAIFSEEVVDFLNEIYVNIKQHEEAMTYTDLVTFGFWCRKANLNKLSLSYMAKDKMVGRGKVLHIAPSNVPMNFAYSFAFGLLSGNINLVRLPSKNFTQIRILCEIIRNVCEKKKFLSILKRFCFFRYEKSDTISRALSLEVDARLIWGGDQTIYEFREYKTQPRCIDLNFSSRVSYAVINSKALKGISNTEYIRLIRNFYNDCYFMDQQGCSSPQVIIWLGKNNAEVIERFYARLLDYVKKNYEQDIAVTNKKILSVAQSAVQSSADFKTNYSDFSLLRLKLKDFSKGIDDIKVQFGTFSEINVDSLDEVSHLFTKDVQTITHFGIDEPEIRSFIIRNGILGVDRIVSFGRAHDIGPIWDGQDIISTISRIICN